MTDVAHWLGRSVGKWFVRDLVGCDSRQLPLARAKSPGGGRMELARSAIASAWGVASKI